jgi:hypothetical protein
MAFDPYLPFKPAPVKGKNGPIEIGSFDKGVEDPETTSGDESEESKNESPSKKIKRGRGRASPSFSANS